MSNPLQAIFLIFVTFFIPTALAQDCKDVKFTKENINKLIKAINMPESICLRTFLDNYVYHPEKLVESEKKTLDELDKNKANKNDFKLKFVITQINDLPFGGKTIQITPQDNPKILYTFWVYQFSKKPNDCEVRALVESKENPNVKNFKCVFKEFLNDKKYAR